MKVCSSSNDWIFLECFFLRLAYTGPPAIFSIIVHVFLPQHLFPQGPLLVGFALASVILWIFLLFLKFWVPWFVLWPYFTYRSKSCWFFNLFSFSLVRKNWATSKFLIYQNWNQMSYWFFSTFISVLNSEHRRLPFLVLLIHFIIMEIKQFLRAKNTEIIWTLKQ